MPFKNDALIAALLATNASGPRIEIDSSAQAEGEIRFYGGTPALVPVGKINATAAAKSLSIVNQEESNVSINESIVLRYSPGAPVGERRTIQLTAERLRWDGGPDPEDGGLIPYVQEDATPFFGPGFNVGNATPKLQCFTVAASISLANGKHNVTFPFRFDSRILGIFVSSNWNTGLFDPFNFNVDNGSGSVTGFSMTVTIGGGHVAIGNSFQALVLAIGV